MIRRPFVPRALIRITIGLALSAPGSLVFAAQTTLPRMRAERTEESIRIDGDLSEASWGLAEPATDFVQRIPHTGQAATERTEVRLLYDDHYLYVGVHCFDSAGPAGIVVNDITRDFYTLDSDGFQIVIDTFDDDRNSFLFGTNPRAGKFDMQIGADGYAGNTSWDGIWYVETRISELGWHVEMAIPFKTLRFRLQEEQTWGVNFERRVRRKFEDSYWALIPPPYRLGRVSLAGTLGGLSGLRQGRNLYLKPYVSAPLVRRENDDFDFVPEAGFDVKYGLSSQLTFDATVNTDFSQVEADEEKINLTRFSLFFPEKREFFLENAGIFEWGRTRRPAGTPQEPDLIPFFSRRIGISDDRLVPLLGGARVSGRAGPYTLGVLSMQTGEFGETPSTNFSVVRLRRDILRQSDIGAVFINKDESGEGYNRTYGVDASFNFFRYLDLNSYLLKTDTPGLSGEDQAGSLYATWKDRFYDFRAEHLWIGENFNPEVGFVPRVGIRKSSGEFAVTPRPERRIPWIRELRPSLLIDYITDREGVLETRRMESRLALIFSDSSTVSVARDSNFERLKEPFEIREDRAIPVGDYAFEEYQLSYQSNRSRIFSGEARFSSGDFYDGTRDSYALGGAFQPSYHFSAQLLWSHNNVDLPRGRFDTDLVTTRLDYAFNPRLFLNALIQYNSDQREFNSNIRFNFIHQPLSDFFLVYNERRATDGEVVERALIAKLTYLFGF